MKKEHVDYLKSIGLSDVLLDRAGVIHDFYRNLLKVEIEDVVVSEFQKPEGSREYENLWLFAQGHALEAKHFVVNDDYDWAPIKGRIRYWNITMKDYDFKKASGQSRLTITAMVEGGVLGGGVSINIKASKDNCDQLKYIFEKYIITNCIKQ